MARYHKSRFEQYQDLIPVDSKGYTYTSPEGWLRDAQPPLKDAAQARELSAKCRKLAAKYFRRLGFIPSHRPNSLPMPTWRAYWGEE